MLNLRTALVFSVFLFPVAVQADDHPISILGTATGAEGSPVVGAAVELLPFVDNYERNRLFLRGLSGPAPIAVTHTDASGRFHLEATSGVYQVIVRAGGLVPMRYFLLPVARSLELPPVSLPKDAGTRIELFHDGRPVPGAAVYAVSSKVEATKELWRPWVKDGWRALPRVGWTDAEGAVSLSRLEDEWLDVDVFPPASATPVRIREVEGARLFLEAPVLRSRTLDVVDVQGRPMREVVVAFGAPAWPAGSTDDHGRLTISAQPSNDPLRAFLMTADGQQLDTWLSPPSGSPDFVFPDAIRHTGLLVDAVTQQPVVGALVWPSHDPGRSVLTTAGGRFELYVPDNRESFWIQAEAAGFIPRTYWFEPERLAAGQPSRLALAPAAAVRGRVVDDEGKPLAGVQVSARPDASPGDAPTFRLDRAHSRAVSDAQGRFLLNPLQPDMTYQITATHRRFITTAMTLGALTPGTPRQVRIELPANRAGFGRVVDLEGRPIDRVAVALRPAAEKSARKRLQRLELPDADPAAESSAEPSPFSGLTDDMGRFEIPALPAHEVDLLAWRKGFAPMVVRAVEIFSGRGAVDLGTLVLEPSVAIQGAVLDSEDHPLEGVSIWAYERQVRFADLRLEELSKGSADAISVKDGSFMIADLQSGTRLDLVAYRAGFTPAVLRQINAPNVESAVLVLEPSVRLDGRVVDLEDRPIAGAQVLLQAQEPPNGAVEVLSLDAADERSAASDADGRFAIEDIRPGAYEVVVSAEGYQPQPPTPVLLALHEDPDELVVSLEPGAVLEGLTLSADGEPVAGARLLVGEQSARSDLSGRYRASGIRPGQHTLEVRHQEYNRLLQPVEIETGRNELDIYFDPGHQVSGRVVEEDGLPVADAFVHLRSEAFRNSRHYKAASSETGRFELPQVAAGEYVLEVEKPGYVKTAATEPVVVVDESVDGLEVELARGAVITGRILGLEFDELATVRVEARGGEGQLYPGSVDFAGSYEIRDLASGDWLVVATLQDGGRQARAWAALEPGARRARRDVEFEEGLVLTGEVLYDLSPLRAAAITVTGHDVAVERQVATDYQGRFRMEDLKPGRYRVTVSSSRELLIHNQDVSLRTDRDLLIEIGTSRVSGTVTSGGEALANALVALRQMHGGEGSSLFTVGTNDEGFFTIARLTEGRYEVAVRKDGYAMAEDMLEVSAGIDVPDLHYELDPTRGLDLVVRFASGRIPSYATVAVSSPSGQTLLSESRNPNGAGYVRFPTVPAGQWEVLVSAPGAAAQTLAVSVPGDPVELIMPDAGRLRIRVSGLMEDHLMATLTLTDPSGESLQGIDPATGTPTSAWSVAGGTALVDGVPAGSWDARVEASDGRSWSGTVVVQETNEITVTLD